MSATWHLLQKEIRLELRQRYALGGVLLYVVGSAFAVYSALGQAVGGAVWAALFWVVVLFAATNAVAKSFVQESAGRQLYYYTLASPTAILLSKTIYNSVLLFVICCLCYGIFSVVLGSPVKEHGLFWLLLGLGSVGFATAFTFISAIAAKTRQSATLMAILSFPVVLPILLTLLRLTKIALRLMHDTEYWRDIVILLSIDMILGAIAFLLFPYLWRE